MWQKSHKNNPTFCRVSTLELDQNTQISYNRSMMRKKRSDRNHVIYQITNTVNGQFYIGITAGSRLKDVTVRVQKHVRRALTENKNWKLCVAIRKFGPENFEYEIVEKVRGKLEVHARERELIAMLNPKLNTQ